MKIKLASALFFIAVLTGCSSNKEVVPIATTPNPADLLAQPPASAMIEPHAPIRAEKGRENSYYSGIMRQNNMYCADDRLKLLTLQAYIRGIFQTK